MGESSRRFDPDRKSRIIDTCLTVIAERGVAGASHRVIAAAADVPLGSMTYHFDGLHDLLHQAFDRYAQQCIDRFHERMSTAQDVDEACDEIARHVEVDLIATQHDLIVNLELYTLAARDPSYRDISNRWMAAIRHELERFFDPPTATMLDALIEGLTLHRALGDDSLDAHSIRESIRRTARIS